ncbi:uncharacterized protein LOC111031021 [Myzus persicae]|uniref:uncharacterized protein LOC111031021 n=1 Tax=Myzus persicae TaxID=13164 RepID=UPI000B939767|nr:uncharacterized protein LOC111031021 [Myzus persicae]XP_022166492.1 uncharacterized protein LOC111031021 [Myzus persicae]
MMIQAATVFAALLAAASCQQLMQQQFSVVDPNSGQTGSVGFMPMKDDRRGSETIPERRTSEPAPESSSPQSRDYSGGPEFYGYNNYPASYGPPSSSYGSSEITFEPSAPADNPSYSSPGGYSPSYYPGYGDDTKKRKPSYATPYYPPTSVSCPSPFTNNILSDLLKTGSTAKFGLVKSVVAAIATLFLAKIPILLAVKALMLKLFVVPLAVVVLSLPVLIPAALLLQPLWKRWKEFVGLDSSSKQPQMVMMMPATDSTKPANDTSATPAATRALENNLESVLSNLLESERCMERLACQLGVRDARSEYKQQVSWVLKFLQTLRVVQNNEPIRDKLKQYREAYNYGTETGLGTGEDENLVNSVCSEVRYPCRSTQKSLQRSTRALVDFAGF